MGRREGIGDEEGRGVRDRNQKGSIPFKITPSVLNDLSKKV
jgi:hypothetical protein